MMSIGMGRRDTLLYPIMCNEITILVNSLTRMKLYKEDTLDILYFKDGNTCR